MNLSGRWLLRILPSVPLAGLVLLYVPSVGGSIDGYATAAASKGVSAIFVIGPTVGAWAAWRGGIVQRGGVRQLAPSRSSVRIAARELTPVALGGLVVLVLGVAWGLAQAGPLVGAPDLRPLGTGAAVVVGHTALGYAVGTLVAPVIAVPGVFVALYLWMVFPQAWEPLWLRHLTGFKVANCCLLWEELDAGALIAPAVVSAAIMIGAALAVLDARWLGVRLAAALLVVAVGSLAAASFVSDLGPDPVRPRTETALVCAEGDVEVCVWPESQERIEEVGALVKKIQEALEPWGVRVPDRVTEVTGTSSGSVGTFRTGSLVSNDLLHVMLLDSLLPRPRSCRPNSSASGDQEDIRATVLAWLATKTGLSRQEMMHRFPPATLARAKVIGERSPANQRAWFQERRAGLDRCAPPEPIRSR